jgi:hypothetical protein
MHQSIVVVSLLLYIASIRCDIVLNQDNTEYMKIGNDSVIACNGKDLCQATETIAASYALSGSVVYTNSLSQINYDVRNYDTEHNLVQTPTWNMTISYPGLYMISSYFFLGGGSTK